MMFDVDDYVISYINELLSFGETMFSPCDSLVYQVNLPSLSFSLLTNAGLKLRDSSPLSCWPLCSCCYFRICLAEISLVTVWGKSHIKVTGLLLGKFKLYP